MKSEERSDTTIRHIARLLVVLSILVTLMFYNKIVISRGACSLLLVAVSVSMLVSGISILSLLPQSFRQRQE